MYTFWLEHVLCFELHIVVRQTKKNFISVLNCARIGHQNDADLSYLNTTCYWTPPADMKFLYLFDRNSVIANHKKRMLDLLPTKLYVFQALDEIDSHIDNVQYQVQKISLLVVLYLKLRILVELIANNLDMQDGLVNGVDGVF